MAAIASLEFSACDSAVWVQCKVSNRFCFYRQILKRRLPDKNFCQRSMCPSVCFHFPHAWAKNGGTCKPTADISSQRHVAHFRDFGFHSRIICDILWLSQGVWWRIFSRGDFQAPSRVIHGGTSHGQSDEKWRYDKARLTFFYLTYLHVIWILSGRSTIMRQWESNNPHFYHASTPPASLGSPYFFVICFSSVFFSFPWYLHSPNFQLLALDSKFLPEPVSILARPDLYRFFTVSQS